MKNLTEREALDLIRATATRSVPNCINLPAIDRILADVAPAPSAERWYVPCGCDTHGDHLGCTAICQQHRGCQHELGKEVSTDINPDAPIIPDGAALIATERQEQIHKHGWDTAHDADYGQGELVQAARAAILLYVNYTKAFPAAYTQDVASIWPWQSDFGMSFFEKIKNKSDVDKLKVAGALIAAEIDRLQAADGS